MHVTLLTPEQARAAGAVLERLAIWWKHLREQLATLTDCIAQAASSLVRLAAQIRTRLRADRPAWASPYGPAPKGFR
ncbi:hypothetical protein ABT301_29260 [Streptomyces sp. NPDC000987]|uniref:hypothetical protein n=1 Tax=Streptomyces sp. NPDC000987 TaxID=3154374 RepID=UPI00331DD5EF